MHIARIVFYLIVGLFLGLALPSLALCGLWASDLTICFTVADSSKSNINDLVLA